MADEGIVPDAVLDDVLQAGVQARLADFDDPAEAEAAFWPGFIHGVRAFLVEDLAKVAKLN